MYIIYSQPNTLGVGVEGTVTYGHVFPLKSLHLLSHDVLQDLKVKDLSQLQTILCKIYTKQPVDNKLANS